MENFSKYLSLILAVAFCGSASFLLGKLMGLGRLDLLWYITFSDIVNYAPATFLGYGLMIGAQMVSDRKLAGVQKRSRSPEGLPWSLGTIALVGGGVVIVAICLEATLLSWRLAVGSIILIAILGYGSAVSREPLTRAFGAFAAEAFETFLAFISITFMVDLTLAVFSDKATPIYTVHLSNRVETSNQLMPMDRGLAILRADGFDLVSWSQVKSVSLEPSAPQTSKPAAGKGAAAKAKKPNQAAPLK